MSTICSVSCLMSFLLAYADFIIGNKSLENDWDAHIATLQSMGLDEYVAIYQAAYDRYMAANQ